MMIRPIGKQMLIKRLPVEIKGSILVAPTKNQPFKAQLLAMGKHVDLDVQIGDTLLVSPWGILQYDLEDEDHLLITEKEILGVVI
jgi:co-chaperonin GroES (HSP10)